jgi:transposase
MCPGRPRKPDEAIEALVQALMVTSPERCGYHATHWTIPLPRDQVRQNLDWQCGEMTMRHCLHRRGYVWKRPRYVLPPDPQREKKPAAPRTWQLARALRGLGGR